MIILIAIALQTLMMPNLYPLFQKNSHLFHGHIHGFGLHLGIIHGVGHGVGYVLVNVILHGIAHGVSHFQS